MSRPAIFGQINEYFSMLLTSFHLSKMEWRQIKEYVSALEAENERLKGVGARIAVEKFNLKGDLREAGLPVSEGEK